MKVYFNATLQVYVSVLFVFILDEEVKKPRSGKPQAKRPRRSDPTENKPQKTALAVENKEERKVSP